MKTKEDIRLIAVSGSLDSDIPVAIIEVCGTKDFKKFLGSFSIIVRMVEKIRVLPGVNFSKKVEMLKQALGEFKNGRKKRFVVHTDEKTIKNERISTFQGDGIVSLAYNEVCVRLDEIEKEEELESISGGKVFPLNNLLKYECGEDFLSYNIPLMTYDTFYRFVEMVSEGVNYFLEDDNGNKAYILAQDDYGRLFTLDGQDTGISRL